MHNIKSAECDDKQYETISVLRSIKVEIENLECAENSTVTISGSLSFYFCIEKRITKITNK